MLTEQLLTGVDSEQPPFNNQLLNLILTAFKSVSVTSK